MITTTITINLVHTRQIGTVGFKNIVASIVEHIAGEKAAERQTEDILNPWGFADICHMHIVAGHIIDGEAMHPEHVSQVCIRLLDKAENTPAEPEPAD